MAKRPVATEIKDNGTSFRVYLQMGFEVYIDIDKETGDSIDCTMNPDSMIFGPVIREAHKAIKKTHGNSFNW